MCYARWKPNNVACLGEMCIPHCMVMLLLFSLTVSVILNKKLLLKQASKQKCLPPSKNLSQYISAPLQQTCHMRDLSSLTSSDPASVIWGLALHHTTKPSARSCCLLPTHLCPFDWRVQWQIVWLRSQVYKRRAAATAKVCLPRAHARVGAAQGRIPHPTSARPCASCDGCPQRSPLCSTAGSHRTRQPSPAGTRRWDQPTLCPISYTVSPQRDFLSLSKFFRGFSRCQPVPTTLQRKSPIGRMFIGAGRQAGGAQLGSQSESNQETIAPPAPPCFCQETRRAWQKPSL